jgi:hypothetical protein
MQLVVLLLWNWLLVDLGHVVANVTVWCLLFKLPHNSNMGNSVVRLYQHYNDINRVRPVTVVSLPPINTRHTPIRGDVVVTQRCLALLHSVDRGRCDITTSREAKPMPFLSQRLRSPCPCLPGTAKSDVAAYQPMPDTTGWRLSSDDGWLRDYCYKPQ